MQTLLKSVPHSTKTWAVQDAKAHFSEMLNACTQQIPQIITKRGEQVAVLVPFELWQKLQSNKRPTLKELLLSDDNRFDLEIPESTAYKSREPIDFSSDEYV